MCVSTHTSAVRAGCLEHATPQHPQRHPGGPTQDTIKGTALFHDTTSHARALCKREQMGRARSGPLHTPFLQVWPDVLGQSLSLLCAQEAGMVRKKEDRDLKT